MANQDQLTLTFLESVRARCPDFEPVLEALGDLYTKSGRYREGLEIDLLLTARRPDHATYTYNLACSYCRMKDINQCLVTLTKAIELGYDDIEWMMKDDDLEEVRKHPDFSRLLELFRKT